MACGSQNIYFFIKAKKGQAQVALATSNFDMVKQVAQEILQHDPQDAYAQSLIQYGPEMPFSQFVTPVEEYAPDLVQMQHEQLCEQCEHEYIAQVPALCAFYKHIMSKLNQVLMACLVLESQLISKQPASANMIVHASEAIINKSIDFTGIGAVMVIGIGAKTVVSFTFKALSAIVEKRERNVIKKKHQIAPFARDIDQISDMIAVQLTLMFEHQIQVLQEKQVKHFAEHLIVRMFEGYFQHDSELPTQGKTFKQQQRAVANMLVQHSVQTASSSSVTLECKNGTKFNLNDMMDKIGIVVPSGVHYCMPIQQTHLTFGFRLGTEQECKDRAMIPCETSGTELAPQRFKQQAPSLTVFANSAKQTPIRIFFTYDDTKSNYKFVTLQSEKTFAALVHAIEQECEGKKVKCMKLDAKFACEITTDAHVKNLQNDDSLCVLLH